MLPTVDFIPINRIVHTNNVDKSKAAYTSISIISSSITDVQGLHNWIKNWTLSARPI